MLRILYLGRFFDHIPGGMQTHVDHLFRAMKGHVNYVHLAPSRNSTSFERQLHGNVGLAIKSRSVDELAQALNRLLADPALCQQLGHQALQRARREFSLESLRIKTLAVYNQAVSKP